MKLDLGAGAVSPEGFTPMGNAHGTEIYPLHDIEDGSVDEIRASHVLEHFSATETINVLQHWASKLRPGGVLKIAVPDFKWIAEQYLAGADIPVQGYTMGGQTAPDDFHKTIFDDECLAESLRLAGLIEIEAWKADQQDCSSMPVSLNLQGTKPRRVEVEPGRPFKVAAVMSVPRLGFMDNFFCAMEALAPMGIGLRRYMGAYWEACLERTITDALAADAPDAILTLDYDTVFSRRDVEMLIQTMLENPEIDALAPIQSARHSPTPLLTVDLVGVKEGRVQPTVFAPDVTPLKTAHFGLTLIRASSLAKLPKPWLWSQPAPDNTWGEGRIDADIYFWQRWAAAGFRLFSANRVSVGHLELMVLWPGSDFSVIHQSPRDYQKNGKPKDVWK